jgi:hypothetical protein
MKLKININTILMIILAASISMGGLSGCKSKKKIAEANQKAEKERMIAKAKADLLALLNDEGNLTLEQKEDELARIKALNIDDSEIQDLIRQVEEKLARDRAAMAEKVDKKPMKESEMEMQGRLSNYFNQIAQASNASAANQLIDQAMSMFASPDVPVLIIINKSGSIVDYDKPTDIRKYLNYLKDQDKNINDIENLVFNDNGKITEVELIRKYEK